MIRTLPMRHRLATMLAAHPALGILWPLVAAHATQKLALHGLVPVDAAGVLACAMG